MKSWGMWGSHAHDYLGIELYREVTKDGQVKTQRQEKIVISERHQGD